MLPDSCFCWGLVAANRRPFASVAIKWVLSCADTSTRTSAIDLFWSLTDRQQTRLKRRSSAANGSMVVRFLIREVLVQPTPRFHSQPNADVAHLSARDDRGASQRRW